MCRARTQDGSIPHSDSEAVQLTREVDSSVNAAASCLLGRVAICRLRPPGRNRNRGSSRCRQRSNPRLTQVFASGTSADPTLRAHKLPRQIQLHLLPFLLSFFNASSPPHTFQSNIHLPRTPHHPPCRLLCLLRPRMVPLLPPPRSHCLRPPPHHRNRLCNPSLWRAPHASGSNFVGCVPRRGKQV